MIKTIKINDIINTDINENNYFLSDEWDIEPELLFNEWNSYLEENNNKILSNLKVKINEITFEELNTFYNIFCDMMINNIDEFLIFYTNEIINKYKQHNKFLYKININSIIDKYMTEKIKNTNIKIYNKYIGNKKHINNDLIILLINEKWMKEDDNGYFNIYILQFKKRMTNIYFLNRIFNYINNIDK